LEIGSAATVEFREQQTEPVRMFVKDGDGFGFNSHVVSLFDRVGAKRKRPLD
jgi:hypothetical protein